MLNFDDSEIENPGRQAPTEQQVSNKSPLESKSSIAKMGSVTTIDKSVEQKKAALKLLMAAGPQNFDPNIQEYEGIDGFPH